MPTYSHGTTIPEIESPACASTHRSSRHRLFRFHRSAAYRRTADSFGGSAPLALAFALALAPGAAAAASFGSAPFGLGAPTLAVARAAAASGKPDP